MITPPRPASGQQLADLRRQHGLRQRDLERYLGVTRVTIANWEAHRQVPGHKAERYRAAVQQAARAAMLGTHNLTASSLPDEA